MCFTIWAQQALRSAPAAPNLTRESSLPDRKVLLERIQNVEAELVAERTARWAERDQDTSIMNLQFSEVESELDAERLDRQRAIDAVKARQDQNMHMVNMQFAETAAKIDVTSGTLESKLASDRQARKAEREQDTNMTSMQFAEIEAKLQADTTPVIEKPTAACNGPAGGVVPVAAQLSVTDNVTGTSLMSNVTVFNGATDRSDRQRATAVEQALQDPGSRN